MGKGFKIKLVTVKDGGFVYQTHRLTGRLNGRRIRKNFKNLAEAQGEKNRLEVLAINGDGAIRPVNTRLTALQVVEAEAAFHRLGERSLSLAVDYFISSYRPPTVETTIEKASEAFIADKTDHVSAPVLVDYRKLLKWLVSALPGRPVHTITTAELEDLIKQRGTAKKSWNNNRTYLHSFFAWCCADRRQWAVKNPVSQIRTYKIARGIPEIMQPAQVRALFEFLEDYAGPARSHNQPGFLVPYFALAFFAGLRPSLRDGELRKIHNLPDKSRVIDLPRGVIRVSPEVAKTKRVRMTKIQPALAAWLERYPIERFPIMVRGMGDRVAWIRKRFAMADDVARHCFCSYHVAAFKSLDHTALEAGNSGEVIRAHYLDAVTESEAAEFWAIRPRSLPSDGKNIVGADDVTNNTADPTQDPQKD